MLAHEIAHVTQRHIARMLGQQQQMQMPMLAALAAAILLGRSRPDLADGGGRGRAGGRAIQTPALLLARLRARGRPHRLPGAGAAPASTRTRWPTFFEKMQRGSRLDDDGSVPGYLRTHPITTERIADAQNRAARLPYKQHPDSPEFQLVRAKLRADRAMRATQPQYFESAVRERRYAARVRGALRPAVGLPARQAREGGRSRTRPRAQPRAAPGR